MRVAGIDCGTNSIRLLIADVDDRGVLSDVVRRMEIVRLGQGVDKTGRFDTQALERTLAAVDDYAGQIAEHGCESVVFAATSATRDAENRDVFINGVRERLGVTPQVLSGKRKLARRLLVRFLLLFRLMPRCWRLIWVAVLRNWCWVVQTVLCWALIRWMLVRCGCANAR